MSDASNREEWKKIAEAMSQETDPDKVIELAKELCDALDRSKPVTDQSAD